MTKSSLPLKYRIRCRIYGYDYFEYSFLDSTLRDMKYGDPVLCDSIFGRLEAGDRVYNKLISDGYIERIGDRLRITSDGLLFLGEGGYTSRYLKSKRASVSFWISILAIIIAMASLFVSWLK